MSHLVLSVEENILSEVGSEVFYKYGLLKITSLPLVKWNHRKTMGDLTVVSFNQPGN